jgi:hypothetical protein
MSALQCLFCQNFNPANADYCNKCDEQLNLQPCYRCGAVDLRTASHCHQCGGDFSPGVLPAGDFQFRPSNFDQESIGPTPAGARAPKSRSPRPGGPLAHSRLDRKSVDDVIPVEKLPPAGAARRGPSFAVWGLLFLLMAAVGVYFHLGQSARVDRPQGGAQPASAAVDPPTARDSAAPDRASALDAVSPPTNTGPALRASANETVQRDSLAAPGAEAAVEPRPLAGADAGSDTVRAPATGKTCPPAVAALGLCNLDVPREKP